MTRPLDLGGAPLLLDGAMGTALLARGLPAGALPEDWLLERPGEVEAVHAGHAAAGACVLLSCTFNAASARLDGHPAGADLGRTCALAVALARRAAGGALVAGALGPAGVATPGGDAPSPQVLAAPFERPVAALAAAGADLLWLESQYDAREARAALAVARAAGLPVVVTFTLAEREGRLEAPGGGLAEPLLVGAAEAGAAAVGVNCVAAGDALTALAAWARLNLPAPFVAKPSPGLPGRVRPPAPFAAALRPALRAGARLVGGCCGAEAGHVSALAAMLRDEGAV